MSVAVALSDDSHSWWLAICGGMKGRTMKQKFLFELEGSQVSHYEVTSVRFADTSVKNLEVILVCIDHKIASSAKEELI